MRSSPSNSNHDTRALHLQMPGKATVGGFDRNPADLIEQEVDVLRHCRREELTGPVATDDLLFNG
ncbi:hypothetical protein Poly41_58970 [Novipirellula artificiosorum]|uniref:Uncharacterized protein n=1 Tax=Novipirellula artificiosorum TaxID=2528016 RepID=A0A5C6DAW9_9BACT|nr:hypothetical protein Poly41_58970 [Novipirellula artificiosorum]